LGSDAFGNDRMTADEPVDGVVLPSQLNRFDSSPWPARVFPILFGAFLVWFGILTLGNSEAFAAGAPYFVPALALIELLVVWGFWRNPIRGKAGDLVVTRRGIVRRFPHRLVFVPWALTERPRRDILVGDSIPYRFSTRSRRPTGRLLLTQDQARAVLASPYRPVDWTPEETKLSADAQLDPHGRLRGETAIVWPRVAASDDHVALVAREPAATAMLSYAFGFMLLAVGVPALAVGYIEGTLLASAAYALPFAVTLFVGRRLAGSVSSPQRALSLVAVLALAPFLALLVVFYFAGLTVVPPPDGYVALPSLSAAMGLEVGYVLTLGTLRPDLMSRLNSSASSPTPIQAA
jgi:hypothetical protein